MAKKQAKPKLFKVAKGFNVVVPPKAGEKPDPVGVRFDPPAVVSADEIPPEADMAFLLDAGALIPYVPAEDDGAEIDAEEGADGED